jgi:hypothetical protein
MSDSKKAVRVSIPVSKTNFNRVKYQTHTLERVLTLEGYRASECGVEVNGEVVRPSLVDLTIKPKAVVPPRASTPRAAENASTS